MALGQLAALALMAWTIRSTDPLDFIGIKHIAGREPCFRRTLITHGRYRYTRHPMYFIVGSYHEEKLLIEQFGPAYLEYRKEVPRIFPGLPFPP